MNPGESDALDRLADMSDHELLLLLDLAEEVLAGMDQLRIQTRRELEVMVASIERRVAELE